MRSIRTRLTWWYAVALTATVAAFGVALYLMRRRPTIEEIDQRLALEADVSVRHLANSYRVLGSIVVSDSGGPALDVSTASFLESIPDFLLVTSHQGRLLFASDTVRLLRFSSFERLRGLAQPPPDSVRSGAVTFDEDVGPARYRLVRVRNAGQVQSVLVAAPVRSPQADPALLLQSMLLIAPIILVGSVLLGRLLAGRSLKPLGLMMEELEAITDGRSLHRRLVVDRTADEVARLGDAVNRMFERLERSFAALRRFTADASHELKTPLMVLRAGVERALTNPRTPPESLIALDESLFEVQRMSELVDSLLTLARADEGRLPLAVEPCDLRELVSEAAETANLLAEPAGLAVTTVIPDGSVRLDVDRNRIRQLLLNLVTNAVKYTAAGGRVSLGLADQGDSVIMTVGDSGIGIAAGDLPHIFDRFWRADPARSREGERPGAGLGLAITKWIAEAHGGTISVQSRPGRGTLFTVTLPRPAAPAATKQ
ncbi:MAG: sensor histidine kinase [Gemmatimonadales bacterium]